MDDKREGTGTAPDSVQRIVADLETIDGKLAELRAAHPAPASTLPIDKARVLLRDMIRALAPAASSETGEDAGSTKRRVKIKAESEVAPQDENDRPGGSSKPASTAAKSASRGKRNPNGATTGRRTTPTEKTPTGSLIARLGAATETSAPPQALPPTQAAPSAETPHPVTAEDSLQATADRLALLEAEIADLTEEAVTAAPTKTADDAAPSNEPAGGPGTRPDASSADDDVDDDAEITIIANGAPREPATRAGRQTPRIFREEQLPEEEEAEVEIRGGDGAATLRGRPTSARASTRAREGMTNSPLGKWRIFRGSS